MSRQPEHFSAPVPEANIKAILEWLALAHGRSGSDDADSLLRQLLLLRDTPGPCAQRPNLLDLLISQAERIAKTELPKLNKVSLPISNEPRHQVRQLLKLLKT